jgi:hypothetical protein
VLPSIKISSNNLTVDLNTVAIRTFQFTNHHLPGEMAVSYKFHVTPKYGKRSVGLTRLISHRHVAADRRDRNIYKIQ